MVRQRSRTGQGKAKRSVIRKDSSGSISEQLPSRDEGMDFVCVAIAPGKSYPMLNNASVAAAYKQRV